MVLEKCVIPARKWQTFAKRGRKKQENQCFFFDMNELERATLDKGYFLIGKRQIYLFC